MSTGNGTAVLTDRNQQDDQQRGHDRGAWRATFASFSVPNFRRYAAAHLLSTTGAWMQRIAQDWLVLSLTGSATAVGITTALQFLPMLVLGLHGGVLADRLPKRRLLLVTQTSAAVLSAALAAVALSGHATVWVVYAMALLLGLVTVVDNPARQLFVHEMVGPHRLRNAVSLSSSAFQLGGLLGPAAAGLLLTVADAGTCFAVTAVLYLPVLAALASMDTRALSPVPVVPRAPGQLREGLRHVASRPQLLWPVVLAGVVGSFGLNMPIVLSAFSAEVFDTGAAGYGVLSSLLALGSLAGALRSARRTTCRLRTLVAAAGAFGVLQATAALAPGRVVFAVLLVAVGAASLTFLTAANATLQLTADPALRGRVMSLYLLVLIGGTPLVAPLIGLITDHAGARAGMLVCGLVPAVVALVTAVKLGRDAGLELRISLHPGWQLARLVTVAPRTVR